MRQIWLAVMFGSALAAVAGAQVHAGPLLGEPQVVPGYYTGAQTGPVYRPGRGYVQSERYGMGQRPLVPQPRSRFGGGLLDAVLGDSDTAPLASSRQAAPSAYAPPGVVAYNGGNAQVDPYGNDSYATRPGKMIDPAFQRQEVSFNGAHPPGTIVIDTSNKFLYLVEGGNRALRYGIGVGRPGFIWTGAKTITRKAEWPDWTPPSEMLLRRPDLPQHMTGGMANPLGARAMYLGSSLYRIHGTNEPETIGTNVSSGCIRLTNEDVSDLYSRVKVGTRVIVM